MHISQNNDPDSLAALLEAHDLMYEDLMKITRKKSKEYRELLEQIVILRKKYNEKCGREMFKIDV